MIARRNHQHARRVRYPGNLAALNAVATAKGTSSRVINPRTSLLRIIRRERGDNFLEARIAAQRIPIRMKLEKAIAK